MTRARTSAALVAGLLVPLVMYTGEAGNGRRMQRWILKGTKPASSVKPPAQEH